MARSDVIDVPFRLPAQIAVREMAALLSNADLQERAKKWMRREFAPEDLYFWAAEISNNRTDSHFTKMHETSLRNYATDALEGVAFLNSHNHNENGLGRSLHGVYDEAGQRTLAQFYTVRGLKLGALGADDFILGMDAGVISDVSIGFKPGEGFAMLCSECGEDIRTWDCYHLPGEVIPAHLNSEGVQQPERTVIGWVHNARLSEVSAVYDGSTPSAMILKAQRGLAEGFCQPAAVIALERRYKIQVPPLTKQFTGYRQPTEDGMSTQQQPASVPGHVTLEELRQSVTTLGLELPTEVTARTLLDTLVAKIRVLQPQAATGVVLRNRLVEDAIREGVRALGNDFKAEEQRAMLNVLDVPHIDTLREAWKGIADKQFAGGRQTTDTPDAPATDGSGAAAAHNASNTLPDAAFGG